MLVTIIPKVQSYFCGIYLHVWEDCFVTDLNVNWHLAFRKRGSSPKLLVPTLVQKGKVACLTDACLRLHSWQDANTRPCLDVFLRRFVVFEV
jgi:hypothetical protein